MQLDQTDAEVQNAINENIVDFTRKFNIDSMKFSLVSVMETT